MGIMTDAGRAALVLALKNQPIFLAIGSGDGIWSHEYPDPQAESTRLMCEIGRLPLNVSHFVTPDDDGEIIMPDETRYAISVEPTRYLYVDFRIGFGDAVGCEIRELGIFVGCKLNDEAARGKSLYPTGDFDYGGILYHVEHLPARHKEARDTGGYRAILDM